jgi:hypothetical protein
MQKIIAPLATNTGESKFSIQDALDRIERGIEDISNN